MLSMGVRGRTVRAWRPAVVILLVAPFFGETLSGATPPLELLQPWNLALMAALYGSGALICREVARRFGLGLLGLCLLGAAYGVYEEALLDRYWFYPQFWNETGVGSYSRFWHTNLLLAVHLTIFHTAISIGSSVLVVERLFPTYRDRDWVGRRGLVGAGVTLLLVVPVLYGRPPADPGPLVLVAAAGLGALLVAAAFAVPRLSRRACDPGRRRRRGLGVVAFAATSGHFVLVYALPATGMSWPAGIAVALFPVVVGVVVVHRFAVGGAHGVDGLRVVTGMVFFFVLLDVAVGLGGRYDLIAGALATAFLLARLRARSRAPVSVPCCADTLHRTR